MSSFTDHFDTRWLPHEGKWQVLTYFEFHSVAKDSGLFVAVEQGYKTDLSSIPLLIRWLIPKVGKEAQGACIHDKTFLTGHMMVRIGENEKSVPVTLGMANSMFFESMRLLKVNPFRYWAIKLGLSAGSWIVWNRYRHADQCSITRH